MTKRKSHFLPQALKVEVPFSKMMSQEITPGIPKKVSNYIESGKEENITIADPPIQNLFKDNILKRSLAKDFQEIEEEKTPLQTPGPVSKKVSDHSPEPFPK